MKTFLRIILTIAVIAGTYLLLKHTLRPLRQSGNNLHVEADYLIIEASDRWDMTAGAGSYFELIPEDYGVTPLQAEIQPQEIGRDSYYLLDEKNIPPGTWTLTADGKLVANLTSSAPIKTTALYKNEDAIYPFMRIVAAGALAEVIALLVIAIIPDRKPEKKPREGEIVR